MTGSHRLPAARPVGLVLLWVLLAATAAAQTRGSTDTVVPGSVRNEVHINVSNDTHAPLVGLAAKAISVPPSVRNLTIQPKWILAIEHDSSAEFTVWFDVAPGTPEGDLDPVVFEVTAERGDLPATRVELRLTVTPAPAITACPIRPDAPDNFPTQDAIDYCDPSRAPHEYDRVAVFFTPPRNLREPIADSPPFHWRIVGPNGNQVPVRGATYGTWGAFAPKLEARRSTPFAKDGSPGRFVAVTELWDRRDKPDPAAATRGPGTYVVQTMAAAYGVEGTFGQGDANTVRAQVGTQSDGSPKYADWEDVASFDVASARLHFQGFVMESVQDIWLPDREDLWEAKLTVGPPHVTGSTVEIGASAWVRKADRDGTGRRPQADVHRARTSVTIEFPQELAPGHERMGEIHARVEPLEKGAYVLTAGMHLMIPTSGQPPDRHLVRGTTLAAPWAARGDFPDSYCQSFPTGQERFLTSRGATGDGTWMWPRRGMPAGCGAREPTELDARTVLLSGLPGQVAGLPERSLHGHLLDPATLWVIPVFVDLTDDPRVGEYSRVLEVKTYGYAIYAAVPGTYAGPAPAGGPPVGDGPDASVPVVDPARPDPARTDPARPDPARTDPARPDPARGAPTRRDPVRPDPARPDPARQDPARPDPSRGDPSRSDPARGDPARPDPTRLDPATLDPTSPDVAPVIREWLGIAEPVENASGANFRYDPWGRLIGSAAPGMGRTVGQAPPPDGGGVPEAYAWSRRTVLDSIDHCTLEEYVMARIAGASTEHCAGRHPRALAVPDVTGMPLADAVRRLRERGFEVEPTLIGPAPRAELSGRVAAQRPASGSPLPRGAKVALDVHGDYVASGVSLPDVRGMALNDAQRALTAVGLTVQPSLLGPAPDAARAGKVSSQTPAPGTAVAAGTAVQVEVWGTHVPPATVPPDPVPPPAATVLSGQPNIQCPTYPFGGPLMPGSGYSPQRDYGYFSCEWENPGSPISTWIRVNWYTSSRGGERFCTAEDSINDVRGGYFVYQPDARSYSRSRRVQVEIRWHDDRERAWIFDLMRSFMKAVEPYAVPCPGAGTAGPGDTATSVGARAAGAPHWVLAETLVNPNREPTDFVVGVTPNYFSDRFNGSFERYSVTETSITYARRWQDRGTLQCDATVGVTFSPPPRELVPGQTVSLTASFAYRGVAPADNPLIRFEFRGQGFRVTGTPLLIYAPFNPDYRGGSSLGASFVVPRVHRGDISLSAFLWNCGACNVTWVYRASQDGPQEEAPR